MVAAISTVSKVIKDTVVLNNSYEMVSSHRHQEKDFKLFDKHVLCGKTMQLMHFIVNY